LYDASVGELDPPLIQNKIAPPHPSLGSSSAWKYSPVLSRKKPDIINHIALREEEIIRDDEHHIFFCGAPIATDAAKTKLNTPNLFFIIILFIPNS
jgi:hypothetical protein